MKPYSVLEKLPAEDYLNPDNFRTSFDKLHSPAREAEKHQEGYNLGKSAVEVHIGVNSVWGAKLRNGGSASSYEGIGYHALTHALLRGILDSKCKLVVHRWSKEKGFTETVIVTGENAIVD